MEKSLEQITTNIDDSNRNLKASIAEMIEESKSDLESVVKKSTILGRFSS